MSLDKVKKKKLERSLEGNIQSGLRSFFLFLILNKFVLKIWISRRVSYLVGILSGVRDILPGYLQVLSLSNVWSKGISELHKSPVQIENSCYK